MSADLKPNAELELKIAHVLFIDTVGYSKLLINEQRELLHELNRIVRGAPRFRAAESAGKLIRLPTGDGMALVFSDSPEEPAECAFEISQALKNCPHLPLRMGIHSGPVSRVMDVNDRSNAAGAGLNIAQRVMSCGDAGHILLSKHAADDLVEYPHWHSYLHEIGECKVKHGAKIALVNLYSDEIGNPQLPSRCKKVEQSGETRRGITFVGWPKIALITASMVVVALVLAVYAVFFIKPTSSSDRSPVSQDSPPTLVPPEKSIAVLPFENLSDDKQNAYFADGVQDEILVDLTKVAELKVISRTSVMAFKDGAERNLRKIARALDVAYVLEGTVRRDKDRVRVSARLIDTRTDENIWAENYHRDLADVFAIQSEIAEKIVTQLKANLSPREKAAIGVRPTRDLEAFDLYLQAKELINTFHDRPNRKETLLKALRFLDDAISRDANFTLAYCWATRANEALYWFGLDHTPARLAQAKATAQKALLLAPDLGEAHLAQALVHYHGSRDYAGAREELAIARRALPNNAEVYSVTGWIDRRQGRWEDAVKNQTKAAELDPRNPKILQDLAVLYDVLRRYDEEQAVFDRAIAANPSTTNYFRLMHAQVEQQQGNLKTARTELDSLPPDYDPDGATTSTRINLALYERDPASAEKILATSTLEELVSGTGALLPRSWYQALIARAKGETQKARDAFSAARLQMEAKLPHQPDDGVLLATVGLIDAGLSRKEEALAKGRRAVELRPLSNDAVDGAVVIGLLALIHTWTFDIDSAVERLVFLANRPGGPDYGQLKFDPAWDALRGDARFVKMVDGLRPRSAHE